MSVLVEVVLFDMVLTREIGLSHTSVFEELPLKPLSMAVPIAQDCCDLFVKFSTDTSSKNTKQSLSIVKPRQMVS